MSATIGSAVKRRGLNLWMSADEARSYLGRGLMLAREKPGNPHAVIAGSRLHRWLCDRAGEKKVVNI